MGGADTARTEVERIEASQPGLGAALSGEDDGAQPGADHPLIRLYTSGEPVQPKRYRRHRFPKRYTREDIEVLASVDEAHETLSGPATQKILQREFHDFGDRRYERLARLSVAQ